MAQTLLEMTKDLTRTLVETGMLSAEDMQDALHKTYATLTALQSQEESGTISAVSVAQPAPVDWRKSITKHAVTCLDCGQTFKQLTIRHLRQHGLDARSYRTKHGIPRSQPLAARETTTRRRQIVQEARPWEKTAMFRRAKRQDGGAAPSQPKRQRETTPKKHPARKKRVAG